MFLPNICTYEMAITGNKNKVEELIQIMQNDYNCTPDEPLHLWRVFNAYENTRESYDNTEDIITVVIDGDCAWSVQSCMLEGGYQAQFNYDGRCNGTTLEKETKRLGLVVEIYSEECGCEFMEHYIIASGEFIENECVEWSEYFMEDFEDVNDFNEATGQDWTQQQFEAYKEDFFEVGGMDWSFDDGLTLYKEYVDKSVVEEEASIDEVSEEEFNAIIAE